MSFGQNIQSAMKSAGISAKQLMSTLEYSQKQFDDMLNDSYFPGVSDILKISTLLDTDISALVYGREIKEEKAVLTTPDDRALVERKGSLTYESLAPGFAGRRMEPFIVTIYKREEHLIETSIHHGEEFIFIMEGTLKVSVSDKEYILNKGDSFYFNSTLPHKVNAITDTVKLIASIFKGDSMVQRTRGKRMKALIEAVKLIEKRTIVAICPDESCLSGINRAIDEAIIEKAYLVGDIQKTKALCEGALIYPDHYEMIDIPFDDEPSEDAYEFKASSKGVALIREKKAHMIMKGKINTVTYVKGILARDTGIGTGRRLSLVGIFEIPGLDRLVMMTDPGINPELFTDNDADSGVDIIKNAIEVARSLGVSRPKVAILDANEIPSSKIPTTIHSNTLSEMTWEKADVNGPLSYDLALYPEFAEKKGMADNPVAGKADILVVPFIATGNILYKSWVMTMGAEVANVVLGATAPIILTSRSDTDIIKFLTICAGALYSDYLEKTNQKDL